jgi:hypothetical protein
MRFSDAFTADAPEVSDGDFLLSCTCGMEQRMDAMGRDALGDSATLYDCARCQTSIAAILTDDAATDLWLSLSAMARRHEVGGHRRNGFVVGARVDIALRPPDAADDLLLIPATPSLFDALRNL